jgi:hypothetical protein
MSITKIWLVRDFPEHNCRLARKAISVVVGITLGLMAGVLRAQAQQAYDSAAFTTSHARIRPAKDKKSKNVYTGATTVVALSPTPMLDERGQAARGP